MADFKLTDQQIADAKRAFSLFDRKGTGSISIKDIGQLFRGCALNVASELLDDWLDEMGVEQQITIDQFLVLYARKKKRDEDEKEIKEAFRVLDKNKTGEISTEVLKWILQSLGDDLSEEEIDQMIANVDTDGSGSVDYSEFCKLMTGD